MEQPSPAAGYAAGVPLLEHRGGVRVTAKSRTAAIDQSDAKRAQMRRYWLERFSMDEIRVMAEAFAFVGIDQEPFDGEVCPYCERPFTPGSAAQVYCSTVCARATNRDRERIRRPLAQERAA